MRREEPPMKVRHKQADYVVEYEVVEESESFYIVKHPSDANSHVCLQKRIGVYPVH